MSALRHEIPLRIRKIFKKSFWRILLTVLAGFILSILFYEILQSAKRSETLEVSRFFTDNETRLAFFWFGTLALIIFWSPIYELLYLIYYFYDMDDHYVIIRKGIIVKQEMTLPFRKITDVYVDQDLLDFILGLHDVHISTPTAESGRFAHIDGLDRAGAMAIKRMILERVNLLGRSPKRKVTEDEDP